MLAVLYNIAPTSITLKVKTRVVIVAGCTKFFFFFFSSEAIQFSRERRLRDSGKYPPIIRIPPNLCRRSDFFFLLFLSRKKFDDEFYSTEPSSLSFFLFLIPLFLSLSVRGRGGLHAVKLTKLKLNNFSEYRITCASEVHVKLNL